MYMAVIRGWYEVRAFSEDKEKAKQLAVRKKKRYCKDDLEEWNWKECEEYYGAYVEKIKEGMVLIDGV